MNIKDPIKVPSWALIMFFTILVGFFSTGWVKIDNLRKELTIEQTSRIYIEKSLERIIEKLNDIDTKIDKINEEL